MPAKGQKPSPRSFPGQWVGGEHVESGSIYARLSLEEQRRLKTWFAGKARESEDYIKSLLLR